MAGFAPSNGSGAELPTGWGPGGRRFKSCLPDSHKKFVRPRRIAKNRLHPAGFAATGPDAPRPFATGLFGP
jgi:hypothetical protein